nr:hypothetical protein [uncultured Desulfobacter sp.]
MIHFLWTNLGNLKMRCHRIKKLVAALFISSIFVLSFNVFGQDLSTNICREGYGSYNNSGQNPDEIIQYGHGMMWYGFRDSGMQGESSRYPGYGGNVSDATINKLNAEQATFIKVTENLRQTIYEKGLYLKAELVKKSPNIVTALGIQKDISEAKGEFGQKMIEHIIRMKKINLEAGEN